MTQHNCPDCHSRRPLFPGKYCIPLSVDNIDRNSNAAAIAEHDQVNKIITTLGLTDESCLTFIRSENTKQIIRKLLANEKHPVSRHNRSITIFNYSIILFLCPSILCIYMQTETLL